MTNQQLASSPQTVGAGVKRISIKETRPAIQETRATNIRQVVEAAIATLNEYRDNSSEEDNRR